MAINGTFRIGQPLNVGDQVYFMKTGGEEIATMWHDSARTQEAVRPQVANSMGELPMLWSAPDTMVWAKVVHA